MTLEADQQLCSSVHAVFVMTVMKGEGFLQLVLRSILQNYSTAIGTRASNDQSQIPQNPSNSRIK